MVLEQDKPVIESQQPKLAPMVGEEIRLELPVGGADAVTLAYRRWFIELIREYQARDQGQGAQAVAKVA